MSKNFKRHALLVCTLGAALLMGAHSLSAQSTAAIALFLPVLQQFRSALDSALNTTDAAAQNRINQMRVETDSLISRVETLLQEGENATARAREQAAIDVTDFFRRSSELIQQNGYRTYVGINSTLVTAARVTSSFPFVSAPEPFVFATDPLRIRPDAQDRLVSIYGFFPDATDKNPVQVSLNGKTFKAVEFSGNRVAFEIPKKSLVPSTFLTFKITIPDRDWLSWLRSTSRTTWARIYVENTEPFRFSVIRATTNPALWANVSASAPVIYRADSAQTANNQVLSAAQLFSITVNDNTTYDASSAKLAKLSHSVYDGVSPCECCTKSTGLLNSWTSSAISFSLSAPTCPSRWCNAFYHCGGGGTHSEISITPEFLVKRRGVPLEVVTDTQFVVLQRDTAGRVPIAEGWSGVTVDGEFRDGDERAEKVLHLTPGVPMANSDYWSSQILGNELIITTR